MASSTNGSLPAVPSPDADALHTCLLRALVLLAGQLTGHFWCWGSKPAKQHEVSLHAAFLRSQGCFCQQSTHMQPSAGV